MPSRRKHTKSRHGCAQCKASHRKCDLTHPTCGRCQITGNTCQFPNRIEAWPSSTPPLSHDQSTPGPSLQPSATSSPNGATPALGPSHSSEADVLSWEDLELLHHYSTITYTTMARRPDLREMWRTSIPKIALKQRFLMHSIFAVTALHIAHSLSSPLSFQSASDLSLQDLSLRSSYIDRGIHHHTIALRSYTSNLNSITSSNSASLFACAALVAIFSLNLAVTRPHSDSTGPIDEISRIFMLLRGVRLVLGETWDWVRESEIAPFFEGREVDVTIELTGDVAEAVGLLEEWNGRTLPSLSSSPEEEEKDRQTYTRAIHGLKECFTLCLSDHRDDGMVLSWPITVGPEYIALLAARKPMALVILAHYAVVLEEIRDSWWVMGWGRQLIREVEGVLEGEWKGLVEWPLRRIGASAEMRFRDEQGTCDGRI